MCITCNFHFIPMYYPCFVIYPCSGYLYTHSRYEKEITGLHQDAYSHVIYIDNQTQHYRVVQIPLGAEKTGKFKR